MFERTSYVDKKRIWDAVLRGESYTLVCKDVERRVPVGFLSVELHQQDVLKGVAGIGIMVDEDVRDLERAPF